MLQLPQNRLLIGSNYATLSTIDKHDDITISGAGLTHTKRVNSSWSSGRSTNFHIGGKYYCEWTVLVKGLGDTLIGFTTSNTPYNGFLGQNLDSIGFVTDGNFYSANASIGGIGSAVVAGDVIGIAIDLDNSKIWARKTDGNWNNSGTNNPTTNVGGKSLSGSMTGGAVAIYAGAGGSFPPNGGRVNFGANGFMYPAPGGFSPWH